MGEERGAYRFLEGKPEGKRPLGRPRHRWVDNIRMDLQDVGVWTGLGWPRIGTGGGRSNEPSGSIKCREFLD